MIIVRRCNNGEDLSVYLISLLFAGGRQSHGHRQHASKLIKIARVVPKIFLRIDRQTHTQTYSSQYFAHLTEANTVSYTHLTLPTILRV